MMDYVPHSAKDSLSVRYGFPFPIALLYDRMVDRPYCSYKGSGFDVDTCGVSFWNRNVARVLMEFYSSWEKTAVPELLIPSAYFFSGKHSIDNQQAVEWLYKNGLLYLTIDGGTLYCGLSQKGWEVAKEHMEHYRSMRGPRMSLDKKSPIDGVRSSSYEYYLADKAESMGRYAY